jgi:hypothetical protein
MPTPESLARQQIDQLLAASGWTIQDRAAARRLRHIIPEGEAVLRSAFEGRLG